MIRKMISPNAPNPTNLVGSRSFSKISPTDVRNAKLNRKIKNNACSEELERYLSALQNYGDDANKIPMPVQRALSICMEQQVLFFHSQN